MSRRVRLGLVQFVPDKWGLESNSKRLLSILADAPADSLDLIIAPECILDGYTVAEAPADRKEWENRERWLRDCALDRSSDVLEGLMGEAARLGSYLVVGYTELVGEKKAANAAGVRCILVPTPLTDPGARTGAWRILDDIRELAGLLE